MKDPMATQDDKVIPVRRPPSAPFQFTKGHIIPKENKPSIGPPHMPWMLRAACKMLPMRDAATAMEVHITPNKIHKPLLIQVLSLSERWGKQLLMKSSKVTVAKALMLAATVLRVPLKAQATKSPENPGIVANISMTKYGISWSGAEMIPEVQGSQSLK